MVTREQFVVQSWVYQVKQYIALVEVGTNAPQVDEATKISFASSFLTGTAAIGGIRFSLPGKSSRMQYGTSLFFLTECKGQGTCCEDSFSAPLFLNTSLNS